MYEKIFAGNLCKLELKRFRRWALISFCLVTCSLLVVLKLYLDDPRHVLNLQLSGGMKYIASNSQQLAEIFQPKKFEPLPVPVCTFSGEKSDFCEITGDVRIRGNSSAIFFTSHIQLRMEAEYNSTWNIKLYARKTDSYVMGKAKALHLEQASAGQQMPQCTVNHTIPAVLFSAGGYAGNFFHAISDVLIPLYLTSARFKGEVQFLIQNKHQWWINKHIVTLNALSKYEIIDLDHDKEVRCFKNVIVGLKAHNDFGIDPEKPPYRLSLRNFTQFVRRAYSLERETAIKLSAQGNEKPKLLIISRKKTRALLNEDKLIAEAETLGYNVVSVDARMDLKNFTKIVNSVDVMIGVHGAGLTNMVYLPENAVLIQVVPLGLKWVSVTYYERPARNMNLRYLKYVISARESSLIEQYSSTHPVITDPASFKKYGYDKFRNIYMDNQDVRLDMSKFRAVLLEALELLRQ